MTLRNPYPHALPVSPSAPPRFGKQLAGCAVRQGVDRDTAVISSHGRVARLIDSCRKRCASIRCCSGNHCCRSSSVGQSERYRESSASRTSRFSGGTGIPVGGINLTRRRKRSSLYSILLVL